MLHPYIYASFYKANTDFLGHMDCKDIPFTLSYIKHTVASKLEKEMVTHSSVLSWRIAGMGEPAGLPSMGSHRFGHN